ncbi:MAG TPA: hypothetical protein PKK78_11735 [Kouleothrix sp.]|jgi:hypothetical protein|nr:hypothetical protein [Kouleothrix sp.]
MTESPEPLISLNCERLAVELKQALQATMFTSTLRVSPRHLQQMATELASAVNAFVQGALDAEAIQRHGQRLVDNGCGHQAIIDQVHIINRFCWETATPALQQIALTGGFTRPLLEGYMQAWEVALLREQERTQNALMRAREASD